MLLYRRVKVVFFFSLLLQSPSFETLFLVGVFSASRSYLVRGWGESIGYVNNQDYNIFMQEGKRVEGEKRFKSILQN